MCKYPLKLTSFATLAITFLLTGCSSLEEQKGSEPKAIPVTTIHPTARDITHYIESIGTLLPSISMEIRPQVSGPLTEVYVKEGEWVQKDTPLFLVDTKIYAIHVQEAQAQLAIDKATLQAIEKKLARFKELADQDLLAETEWDELYAQAAKGAAAVEMDQARLAAAQLELDKCTIRSPIDGRIGKLDAHPGLLVAAGQPTPLATVSQLDPLIIEFTVTEREFPHIPADAEAIEIQPLCSSEECKGAKITFMDNHFDKKSGLLLIRGRVDNPDYKLRPGQSLRVKIPTDTLSGAILIPHKAVRFNQEGPYVFVIEPDMTATQRALKIGGEQGDQMIILEGLKSDDTVVLDGHMRVSPGIKVDIKS